MAFAIATTHNSALTPRILLQEEGEKSMNGYRRLDLTRRNGLMPSGTKVSAAGATSVLRSVFAALSVLVLGSNTVDAQPQEAAGKQVSSLLQSIIDEAAVSARHDYEVADHGLDEKLTGMDYQQYRAIRFRPEQSLWKQESVYDVQLFHPGFLYDKPVTINTVSQDETVTELPFETSRFRYDKGAEQFAGLTNQRNGYAGFRLHYPLNTQDYNDEFVVFLGASYFRLIGQEQVYGLSARGLAIDTGLPAGEEFPHFTEFWLHKPDNGGPITVYARLESKSVTGAYAFTITPGRDTQVDVQSWIFARQDVEKLGIAPFTSMYLYGENTQHRPDDYRPEVHDSDGVLMQTHTGERIWRPLTNPNSLHITSLSDDAPRGFGLLQRDQQWQSYLDAEANYHRRPGLWVTPKAGFDSGRLELVEIPTDTETHDNIVAYWVPASPMKEGDKRYFAYQLSTVAGSPLDGSVAKVIRTRHGSVHLPGEVQQENTGKRRFTVDFTALAEGQPLNTASLMAEASNATISEKRIYAVNGGQEWRATFLVTPTSNKPVDMRVYIAAEGTRLSEVWNYVYQGQ